MVPRQDLGLTGPRTRLAERKHLWSRIDLPPGKVETVL